MSSSTRGPRGGTAPRGDHVPTFDKVEIGDGGLVWIREYVLDEAEATWQVLDPETGSLAARLRAPAAWGMLQFMCEAAARAACREATGPPLLT
jgi:hypothetical protein